MEIKKNLAGIARGTVLGLSLLVAGCGSGQDGEVKNLTYRGYHINKTDGEYSLVFDKPGYKAGRLFATGEPTDFVIGEGYDVDLDYSIFGGLPEVESFKLSN